MKYAFIWRHREQFKIARLCGALGVSRSGFYDWLSRPESRHAVEDRELLRQIRALHLQARQAYGAYKTWKVLKRQGIICGRHRVARLRRQNGIEALRKRRFRIMTEHHKLAPPAPNLLQQNFTVLQPDRVWAGDMTVVATGNGWLHLAVLLDLFSRRVVGWAMGNKRSQDLSLNALQMALDLRQPDAKLIHHSDRGSAYSAADYQSKLLQIGNPPVRDAGQARRERFAAGLRDHFLASASTSAVSHSAWSAWGSKSSPIHSVSSA